MTQLLYKNLSTHFTEGRVGSRTGLDVLEKTKISWPCWKSSHNSSAVQPEACWTGEELWLDFHYTMPLNSAVSKL
jgi:hypothetical protein